MYKKKVEGGERAIKKRYFFFIFMPQIGQFLSFCLFRRALDINLFDFNTDVQ